MININPIIITARAVKFAKTQSRFILINQNKVFQSTVIFIFSLIISRHSGTERINNSARIVIDASLPSKLDF